MYVASYVAMLIRMYIFLIGGDDSIGCCAAGRSPSVGSRVLWLRSYVVLNILVLYLEIERSSFVQRHDYTVP